MHISSAQVEEKSVNPLLGKYAIVGIGCKLPKSPNKDKFWELLSQSKSGISSPPGDRFNEERLVGKKNDSGKTVTLDGGYLDNIGDFDPLAFGIGYNEAEQMSIQQRLTLEVAHACLDDAGIPYKGRKIGVFSAGTLDNEVRIDLNDLSEYYMTGTQASIIANRISFVFDLRGPSVAMDTACSSSLTAVNMAIASLERGDCSMALVTGANHLQSSKNWVGFSHLGIISPDGVCKTFDKDGNGYVRGEGAGAILLKPLQTAIDDKDTIYSIVTGSALNSCGRGPSLTYPGKESQAQVYRDAFASSSRSPADVCLAEFHGTGTLVGDPIECNAAGEVFAAERPAGAAPVTIGSVKTNIGHLEMASGIAALIKASLMIYHKKTIPSLNCQNPNTAIKWKELPLKISDDFQDLKPCSLDGSIVGTVSSFGFGGSNSVLILESHTRDSRDIDMEETQPAKVEFPLIFPVGAMTNNTCNDFINALPDFISIEEKGENYDKNLAMALGRRSRIYNWRSFAVSKKSSLLSTDSFKSSEISSEQKLVFVFSGQGPQHLRMGHGLFARYNVFRESILLSDSILMKEFGFSLVNDLGMFDESSLAKVNEWPILKVVLSITCLQIALYDLWVATLNRKPDTVMGHSVGEIAMLYGCGAVSRVTCLRIAVGRAKSMEIVDGNSGGMVALGCSSTIAEQMIKEVTSENTGEIKPGLWVAADNSAEAITVAGYTPLVEKLCALAQSKSIFARVLKVASAFHSPLMQVCQSKMMNAMEEAFQQEESGCVPTCQVVAAVNGDIWPEGTPFTPEYMWKNMRQSVLFRQSVEAITAEGPCCMIELAPHPVLASSITSILDSKFMVSCMIRPKANSLDFLAAEVDTFLNAAGKIFALGYHVDFDLLNSLFSLEKEEINLPEYPLHKKLIWPPESRAARAERLAPAKSWLGGKMMHLSTKNMPWFAYHVIDGMTLLPGASYLAMMFERGAKVLRNVSFEKMMSFSPGQTVVAVADVDPDLCRWSIKSSAELISNPDMAVGEANFNIIHSRGEFSLTKPDSSNEATVVELDQILPRLSVQCDVESMESRRNHYYQFGDIFCRSLSNVMISPSLDELLCDLQVPEEFYESVTPFFKVHPGMIDAMFQAVFFLAMDVDPKLERYEHKWLPHSLGRICRLDNEVESFDFSNTKILIKKTKTLPDYLTCNLSLLTGDGTVILNMDDCTFKLVAPGKEDLEIQESLYETFVEYGMPLVDIKVEPLLDCKRNLRLYQYTDAVAYDYIRQHAEIINQEASSTASLDRVRFRKFCRNVLENFSGPVLQDFSNTECEYFNNENMVITTERIGKIIPEVLEDSSAGIESLFGDQVFTSLYNGDIWTHEFNDLISHNFRECLMKAKAEGKRVLRVLEVGAGSGGLTTCLDPVLIEADKLGMHVDYVATDVTTGLESELIARIKHRDFSATKFDISNPDFAHRQSLAEGSVERSIGPEEFDIIVSVCVLHVLPEIQPTCQSIYDLLRPGGYLLTIDLNRDAFQNNRSPFSLSMDLFLGATQQWFGYNEEDVFRQNKNDNYPCCLLSTAQWTKVLEDTGFGNVECAIEGGSVPMGLYFQSRKPAIDLNLKNYSWPYKIATEPSGGVKPDIVYIHAKGNEMVLVEQVKKLQSRFDECVRVWILAEDSPEGAKAVGMGRCITNEYPNWKVMILSFGQSLDQNTRDAWFARISSVGEWHAEKHYLVDDSQHVKVRRVTSVSEVASVEESSSDTAWSLHTLDPKARDPFNSMIREKLEIAPLGDFDVRVQSLALGLNFRCLLSQIGVLEGEQASNVTDFSGTVLEVGPKVTRFQKGDFVMGVAEHLSNVVTCYDQYVAKAPADLSRAGAASFFVAYMTAWFSLITTANIQAGERLLISQATSSLGLASIQIAQRIGCKIFCTAGTEQKRQFLIDELGLSKDSVSDSRNVETWTYDLKKWAEALDEEENCKEPGLVDVVMNTVSGPGLKEGVQSLRVMGRFIELGKRDVYGETYVKLFNLAKNCAFHVIDLTMCLDHRRSLSIKIMDDILKEHSKKPFKSFDRITFPWFKVGEAFKLMQKGTHVGKIVLDQLDVESNELALTTSNSSLFSAYKTYILVGGCGGIGIKLARWMVDEGARNFILTSRSGRKSVEKQGVDQVMELHMLESTVGVNVKVMCADASSDRDMKSVLSACEAPLGGVFQMGLVLRDAALKNVSQATFDDVYLPKVNAMEVMLNLVNPADLDFVVLFSSLAGFVGNMGQISYVAASCYLDSLSKMKNVISVEVPSVSQVGFFSRMRQETSALEGLDTFAITPNDLFSYVKDAIKKAQICDGPYVCSRNWLAIKDSFDGTVSVYRHLINRYTPKSDTSALTNSGSDSLEVELAKLLNLEMEEIQLNAPLSSLGLDSLSAVKLSKMLSQKFGITVSQMQLLGDMTIARLISMRGEDGEAAPGPPVQTNGIKSEPATVVPVNGIDPLSLQRNNDSGISVKTAPAAEETLSKDTLVLKRKSVVPHTGNKKKKTLDDFSKNMAKAISGDGRMLAEVTKALEEEGVYMFQRVYTSPASNHYMRVVGKMVENGGEDGINFAVQDYLGLCQFPEIAETAISAIRNFGVNGAGAPLLGRSKLLHDFETRLAQYIGFSKGMVYSTGWMAVFGSICALVSSRDSIIMDEFSHNCCQFGARHMTQAVTPFLHNDLVSCEIGLRDAKRRNKGNIFVLVESLYSMHSDSPDLPGFLALSKKYGAKLIVDCAHSLGATGEKGWGGLEALEAADPSWRDHVVVVGSFSKSFGGIGGYCLTNDETYSRMILSSPTYTFSAQITPSQVAVASKCAEIIYSPSGDKLRKDLRDKSAYLRKELEIIGLVCDGILSPIIMLGLSKKKINDFRTLKFQSSLMKAGIQCNACLYPAVRIGESRLRLQLMATMPRETIDQAISIIKQVYSSS